METTNDAPEIIALDGGDLRLYRELDLGEPQQSIMQALVTETPWRQERITLFGKNLAQPRLSAWYGDSGGIYRYSGLRLEPLAWTARLLSLKSTVEAITGHGFNSLLVNYYRDQNDSMGMHSDDEPELGNEPMIASLSLGETRVLVLKHRYRKDLATLRLPLPPASLLLMKGATQSNWKHGISRETRPREARINLTFRTIVSA